MPFQRATIDESNGSIILEPGVRYFFDTQESEVFPTLNFGDIKKDLLVSIPNEYIVNLVRSGSGQVIVEVRPTSKIVVPNETAVKTGFFYIIPNDKMSLRDIQTELYGSNYNQPRGLFEFLADTNPDLMHHMLSFAEGVKEVGDKVASNAKSLVTTIVIGAIGVVILAFAVSKLKKG